MNEIPRIRRIIFYRKYFENFYLSLKPSSRSKLIWTFDLIERAPRVPIAYLKHLSGTSGLYEIRATDGSDQLRVFCFFNRKNEVVVINGFKKKTQRTPSTELQRALTLKLQYQHETN